MQCTLLKSNKTISVNHNRYRIRWSEPSASKMQTNVKVFLYNYWRNCIVLEEFKIPGSRLRCDFINLNKKIAIEVQGDQHFDFNSFFHHSRTGFKDHIKRDMLKYNWLTRNEFSVIELMVEDVHQLTLQYIKEKFGVYIG